MSSFLYHTSCSNCGSRDNLGIYTDHEFCFGCGYTKHYSPMQRLTKTEQKVKPIYVPDDIITTIPYQAHDWLLKYGLTQQELIDNRVVWSEKSQLLIFLYVQHGILVGWQGRYFGSNKNKPKWWSQGNLKSIDWLLKPKHPLDINSIIIVEDIVSSIKLSRFYNSKPLFGSYIDISSIYNKYKENTIYLWLDQDKRLESYKASIKLNSLGLQCRTIVTKKDPKEYTNEEIKRIYESQTTHHSSSTRLPSLVGIQTVHQGT